MEQKTVSDLCELFQRLSITDGRRSAAEVAGGHHQRALRLLHQQMVQRIGREHHTEAIRARRDVVREGRQPALGISTMGAAGERSRVCTGCGRPSAFGIITASGFPDAAYVPAALPPPAG